MSASLCGRILVPLLVAAAALAVEVPEPPDALEPETLRDLGRTAAAAAEAISPTTSPAAEEAIDAGEPIILGSELLRLPEAERQSAVQEQWLEPPLVELPAGRVRLSEAVAALDAVASTELHPDCDGERQAELAGGSGDYWSQVLAVCTAFDLSIEDALPVADHELMWASHEGGRPRHIKAIIPHTTVRLAPPQPGHRYVVVDNLLMTVYESISHRQERRDQVRHWQRIACSLRWAPQTDPSVQWNQTYIDIESDADANDLLVLGGGELTTHMIRLMIVDPPQTNARSLSFSLRGTLFESVDERIALETNKRYRIDIGEQSGEIIWRPSSDPDAPDGAMELQISSQHHAMWRLDYNIMNNDRVAYPDSSNHNNRDQLAIRTMRYDTLPRQGVELQISGYLELPEITANHSFRLPAPATAAPADRSRSAASIVTWPAGEHRLGDLLDRLRADGNSLLTEMGIDEDRRATLPPFTGGFWDATLMICEHFDLSLDYNAGQLSDAPSRQEAREPTRFHHRRGYQETGLWEQRAVSVPVRSNPFLTSERGRERHFAAHGPLLTIVEASGESSIEDLDGRRRTRDLRIAVLVEPRLAGRGVAEAQILWNDVAHVDGHLAGVSSLPASDGDAGRSWVSIDGAETAEHIILGGVVRLTYAEPFARDHTLQRGDSVRLNIAGDTALLALTDHRRTLPGLPLMHHSISDGLNLLAARGRIRDLELTINAVGQNRERRFGGEQRILGDWEHARVYNHHANPDQRFEVHVAGRYLIEAELLPLRLELHHRP